MLLAHLFDLPCLIVVLSAIVISFIACGQNRHHFFRLAAILCLPVGAMGTEIGWLKMLSDMTNPDAFGPASSVASFTIMYAFLFFPLLLSMGSRFANTPLKPNESARMRHIRVGGSLSLLGVLLLTAMVWKGSILYFIQIESILCIGLFVAMPTFLHGPLKREETLFLSRCVVARNYSVVATISGLLIGTAGLLSGIDDPSTIGPNIALILLTSLYSGFIIVGSTLAYQVYAQKEIPHALVCIMGYMSAVIIGMLLNNAIIIRAFIAF